MNYLLDTDIFNHFHGGHRKVRERVAVAGMGNLAITVITRMEVLQGRFEFLRKAANAAQLATAHQRLVESDQALRSWDVVALDESACREFDHLRQIKGLRRIGRADLLIACIAIAQRATLVTRNVSDFSRVPGIRIENWCD